jgi:hypothetical protein
MRAHDKMISFRLSMHQYERFRALSETMGIDSVSELARAAVDKLIYQPETSDLSQAKLELRIARLENQIDALNHELRLTRHDGNEQSRVIATTVPSE